MTNTLFIRLLNQNDKGETLARRIAALREGAADEDMYAVNPESFRQVPNTPFCYWVSERIRRLFKELPPFESEGRTVKQGLATADDFRFVRAWWEVPAERILDGEQWAVGSGRWAVSGDVEKAGDRREEQAEKWTEERIRDFQAWCRRRTYEGKRWVPFAKGGVYSPYYADIHLVVNWEKDGAEMKAFSGSVIRNPDYYFRPGLTWPRRTQQFGVRVLTFGALFADKGPAAFGSSDTGKDLLSVLSLMLSCPFGILVELSLNAADKTARSFEVGIIQGVPVPIPTGRERTSLTKSALSAWSLKRSFDLTNDTTHAFTLPTLLQSKGATIAERTAVCQKQSAETEAELSKIESEVDGTAFDLYGFTEEERKAVSSGHWAVSSEGYTAEGKESDEKNDEDFTEENNATPPESPLIGTTAYSPLLTAHLFSWCVGVAFGRWDIRFALPTAHCLLPTSPGPFDPLPVCPPGMLVGADGLPAEPNRIVSEEWLRKRAEGGMQYADGKWIIPEGDDSLPTANCILPTDSEYPLRISWDGVLVDDPGFNGDRPHRDDIVRRVREVFDLLWKDKSHEIEQEACDILGVSDLRDYFRRPAGFFQDHLKRYSKSRRKAPIYWPLSTASGSYTIWFYYHRLNDQTLYMVVNKYVEPKIAEVQKAVDSMQYAVEARERGITDSLPTAHCPPPTGQLRQQLEEARAFLGELGDLREELLRIAALPYKPDLNDGVIINAAPLHKLFRLRSWAKDTEECWKKLAKGDYDWAHLAYTIWPDRVREVCKRDRSIAIAHGLEDLCEVEAPESKKRGGRRKKKLHSEGE